MKKCSYLFLLLLVAIVYASCEDDESPAPQPQEDYTDINIVTGINLFDDNGSPLGRWRSPNDNGGEILIYPNPNAGTLFVQSPQNIIRVILASADCLVDSTTANIPTLSQSLVFSEEELEGVKIKDILIADMVNQLAVDFSDVSPGFYKLFVQIEGGQQLFWQNLYIDPSVNNFPSFEVLDTACD